MIQSNNRQSQLSPCYTVHFSQQLVLQCRCETSCWRIAQCNMGCLTIFLVREALHEVELSSSFCNELQQLTILLHSVIYHPSSNLSHNFMAVLTRAHVHTSCFLFRGALRDKLLRKLQFNGPSTPNFGNLQRYIFNHCKTSC